MSQNESKWILKYKFLFLLINVLPLPLLSHQTSNQLFNLHLGPQLTKTQFISMSVKLVTHTSDRWKQLELCVHQFVHVGTYRWKSTKINTRIYDFSCLFICVYRRIYKLVRVINTTQLVITWLLWLWCANENPRFRFAV